MKRITRACAWTWTQAWTLTCAVTLCGCAHEDAVRVSKIDSKNDPGVAPVSQNADAGASLVVNPVASTMKDDAVLPSGFCTGYFAYSEACEDVPPATHAVLLADGATKKEAEALVATYTGKLAPGYPLVVTASEMPIDTDAHAELSHDAARSFIADGVAPPRKSGRFRVIGALFGNEAAAARFNENAIAKSGSVHALGIAASEYSGSGDYEAFERGRPIAIEIVHDAPAYSNADIERIQAAMDAGRARTDNDRDAQWDRELPKLTPACTPKAGEIFETNRQAIYHHSRRFASIDCRGNQAWIAWTATRYESVIRVEKGAAYIYQILDVMCDSADIEKSPFTFGAPLPKIQHGQARCGRGRS